MKYIVLALTIFLLFHCAQSFWDAGHIIVARIAYDELLEKSPDFLHEIEEEINELNKYDKVKGLKNPFVESAVWADTNKKLTEGRFNNLHYIDIPYYETNAPKIDEDAPNVVKAIGMIKDRLRNKTNTLFDDDHEFSFTSTTSFAWRYLIHLVGDIHQPLHATTLYSKQFKKGDRGGNYFNIEDEEDMHISNLHKLWDSCVAQYKYLKFPVKDWAGLTKIVNDITAQFPRSKVQERVKILDENVWVKESHEIAVKYAYDGVIRNENQTPEYLERGRRVINEQLAVAGYRLTDLILTLKPDNQGDNANKDEKKEDL